MKKLIWISFVFSFVLVACSNNTHVQTSDENSNEQEYNNNITEISGEYLQTEVDENDLIEHYKLCDGYTMDKLEYETIYNLISNGNLLKSAEYYKFDSDEKNHIFECSIISGEYFSNFDLKLNNECLKIKDVYGNNYIEPGKEYGWSISIGIIDLDNNDSFKEMVLGLSETALDRYIAVYRVRKDNLELLHEFKYAYGSDIYKTQNNKYIFPIFNTNVLEEPVMGYYMYEDNEFKLIDRFLNGEKIKDEAGNYNKNFAQEIFTSTWFGDFPLFWENNIDSEKYLNNGVKIKFLKEYKKDSFATICNIEIAEDTYWGKNNEALSQGTILDIYIGAKS